MTVQLLQYTDSQLYAFEHQMDTRTWISLWGTNRPGFTSIPYFLDTTSPDAAWELNHQTSHTDAMAPPPTPAGPFGAPVNQNLRGRPSAADPWWIHANHQEHLLSSLEQAQNQHEIYYPFW